MSHPLLQALIEAPAGVPAAPGGIVGASPLDRPAPPVQKLSYSHLAMAKVIAANPAISQNELAALFGYSASWISRIMCSDAFQAILAEEMKDMPFTAEMRTQTRLQVEALLQRSLEILAHKLDKTPDDIPDQLALQTAKVASSVLSDRDPRPPATEVHVHLEKLGENLVGLLRRRKSEAAVDAEIVPATSVAKELS